MFKPYVFFFFFPSGNVGFVVTNLWSVKQADGTPVESAGIASLKIIVTGTIVETYADVEKLSLWGLPQVIDYATSRRSGGYSPGDKI